MNDLYSDPEDPSGPRPFEDLRYFVVECLNLNMLVLYSIIILRLPLCLDVCTAKRRGTNRGGGRTRFKAFVAFSSSITQIMLYQLSHIHNTLVKAFSSRGRTELFERHRKDNHNSTWPFWALGTCLLRDGKSKMLAKRYTKFQLCLLQLSSDNAVMNTCDEGSEDVTPRQWWQMFQLCLLQLSSDNAVMNTCYDGSADVTPRQWWQVTRCNATTVVAGDEVMYDSDVPTHYNSAQIISDEYMYTEMQQWWQVTSDDDSDNSTTSSDNQMFQLFLLQLSSDNAVMNTCDEGSEDVTPRQWWQMTRCNATTVVAGDEVMYDSDVPTLPITTQLR
ncbi:hypothetical protein J6590_003010 [Homalodisca vitripennis]|nr:hypothetical protein J6590_003010 [Homalodisca vitripennis]